MKRRNFLSMVGAAAAAPILPSIGASQATAAVATGYNRYMYGLAVFHARTRAGLTTADLMARLRISAVQAEAMMGEMTARGVLTPALGAVRVATAPAPKRRDYLRKALRKAQDMMTADEAEEAITSDDVTETTDRRDPDTQT